MTELERTLRDCTDQHLEGILIGYWKVMKGYPENTEVFQLFNIIMKEIEFRHNRGAVS